MKMDPVQVLFRHLETAEFVPKMAGCRVVVLGYQVGLEFQAVLTVLEDLGPQVFLVHHPFLVRHHFQMTQMLQVEFHLVVGCNFSAMNKSNQSKKIRIALYHTKPNISLCNPSSNLNYFKIKNCSLQYYL